MRRRLVLLGCACVWATLGAAGGACRGDSTAPSADGDASDLADADTETAAESLGDTAQENEDAESEAHDDDAPLGCNGDPALCERSYAEVSFLTAHNAMSNADEGWNLPNQSHPLSWQLENGVRAFMWDLHDDDLRGEPGVWLCHGWCGAGSRALVPALRELGAFLDAHPREIVTLIFESYVAGEAVGEAFAEAGLRERLAVHDPARPWPTLAALAAAGTPLVVFTDRNGGAFPGYLPVWDHAVETPFAAEVPADLDCSLGRGDAAHPLFILNHFLTAPFASRDLAEQVNHAAFLQPRAEECARRHARAMNFVTLDFVDIGDGLAVVQALNAAAPHGGTSR